MGFYTRIIFPRVCDWVLGSALVARHRQRLLAGVNGDILEIGFGTGLNLPCYPPNVRKLTTVDPNVEMAALAHRRINQAHIEVDQQVLSGEQLPFGNDTFDCVVSTFTLCSIVDVGQALTEVYRVVKPSGRFFFLEHGLAPEPKVQKWQQRLNWLEMQLADGCRLDRDIGGIVASQPFSSVRMEQFYMPHFPKTHGYISRGIATK